MNTSAIKGIFRGFRGHIETMRMPKSDSESPSNLCDAHDELKKKLSPELLDLHQKVVDAIEDGWSEELDFYFAEGFKLGLHIGIECTEN